MFLSTAYSPCITVNSCASAKAGERAAMLWLPRYKSHAYTVCPLAPIYRECVFTVVRVRVNTALCDYCATFDPREKRRNSLVTLLSPTDPRRPCFKEGYSHPRQVNLRWFVLYIRVILVHLRHCTSTKIRRLGMQYECSLHVK